MKVFQVLNSEVLIIDGKQQYRDSVENFSSDCLFDFPLMIA